MKIAIPERLSRPLKAVLRACLWIFGGGALIGFTFAGCFYMSMKSEMRSTEVVVPDLRGLKQVDASQQVENLGLQLQVVDQRHDPDIASGRILQQEPPGGATVRRGRRLKLVLSLGGKTLTVPDLVGKANRAVQIELRRDGFSPGDVARIAAPGQSTGRILAQVPPAGSPGVPNTRVHRLVSDGPPAPRWVMPDLTGRSRRSVERWLDRVGLRYGRARQVSMRNRAPGTIIGQFPLAGHPIEARDVVELTVAR